MSNNRRVTLTVGQLLEVVNFGGPDYLDDKEQLDTEMTIVWCNEGHSGKGYYAFYADCPEDGAIKLSDN